MVDSNKITNQNLNGAESINETNTPSNETQINLWNPPSEASNLANTSEEIKQPNLSEIPQTENYVENNQLNENSKPAEVQEVSENPLWSFDNTTNTIDETKDPSNFEIDTREQERINNEQKTKEAQKENLEKLEKIINQYKSKARKSWFLKWIFSGVALTAVIVVASYFCAKDQILNLINGPDSNPPLSASVIDLNENEINNEEDLTEIEETDLNEEIDENNEINEEDNDLIDENNSDLEWASEEDENVSEEVSDENEEDTTDTTELNENEETNNTEVDELEENENNEQNENDTPEEKKNSYSITHVNSEEEANWVLPEYCTDLSCYGEDKEFTPCTQFRLNENLNENSPRIWNSWVCRYKDTSELVYIEFFGEEDENSLNNNMEDENSLNNNMEDEKRERDVLRKTALSQLQAAIVTYQWDTWIRPGIDKWATSWIIINKINEELKSAWMYSIPVDPISSIINYWLWILKKNNTTAWEYTYLLTKRNWNNNGWFALMAKTEVPWASNWLVCENKSWLTNWYITNDTDLKDIKLCKELKKWDSCSAELCTYTNEDELRYIILY